MKKMNYTIAHRELIRGVLAFVFSAANMAVTSSVAAFLVAVDFLQTKLDNIDSLYVQRSNIITGIAAQKKLARIALATNAFSIMSAVRAYAISINDSTLAADMKVTLSGLLRMPYQKLADRMAGAIATVTPLVPSLAAYNITVATIKAWQKQLDTLNSLLTGPNNAISLRKSINKQIQAALMDAMDFMKNSCDPTATLFIQPHLDYYTTYQANRKIKITGIHHSGLDATIQNPLGFPFVNALVTIDSFVKNKKTYKAVSLLTDINGFAPLREFEPGIRTVTVSGTGIVSQTFPAYDFEKGRIIKAILTCTPGLAVVAKQAQKKLVKK